MVSARLCSVRKNNRSSLGSKLNRAAARSFASFAAFRVNAKKAMRVGSTPSSNALSTMLRSVVVLPVPGGPKILNILCLFPVIDLLHTLLGDAKQLRHRRHCHSFFVD